MFADEIMEIVKSTMMGKNRRVELIYAKDNRDQPWVVIIFEKQPISALHHKLIWKSISSISFTNEVDAEIEYRSTIEIH